MSDALARALKNCGARRRTGLSKAFGLPTERDKMDVLISDAVISPIMGNDERKDFSEHLKMFGIEYAWGRQDWQKSDCSGLIYVMGLLLGRDTTAAQSLIESSRSSVMYVASVSTPLEGAERDAAIEDWAYASTEYHLAWLVNSPTTHVMILGIAPTGLVLADVNAARGFTVRRIVPTT